MRFFIFVGILGIILLQGESVLGQDDEEESPLENEIGSDDSETPDNSEKPSKGDPPSKKESPPRQDPIDPTEPDPPVAWIPENPPPGATGGGGGGWDTGSGNPDDKPRPKICIKDGKPCGNSWHCCSGWCNLQYKCEKSDWYGVGPLPEQPDEAGSKDKSDKSKH